MDDRATRRRAAGRRSSAVASGRGQILRRDWGRRPQRSRPQRTRRGQAAVIRARPVRVTSRDRSLYRWTGEGAVRRRRDRLMMLRGRVWISGHRIGWVQLRASGMVTVIRCRVGEIVRGIKRSRPRPRWSRVMRQRLDRCVQIERFEGRFARHEVQGGGRGRHGARRRRIIVLDYFHSRLLGHRVNRRDSNRWRDHFCRVMVMMMNMVHGVDVAV